MDRQLSDGLHKEFKITKITDNLKKTILSKTGFNDYVNLIKTCKYLHTLGTGELIPERFELSKCILAVVSPENGETCVQIVNNKIMSYSEPRSYPLHDIHDSFKNVHFGSLEVPVLSGADIFYLGDALNIDDPSLFEVVSSLGSNDATVDRIIVPFAEWKTVITHGFCVQKLKADTLILTSMEPPYELSAFYEMAISSDEISWLQLELSSRQQHWLPEVVRLHEFWQKKGPIDSKVIVLRMFVTELPLSLEEHIQLTAEKIDNFGCGCRCLIIARFSGEMMPLFLVLLCVKSDIFAFCLYAAEPQSIFTCIHIFACIVYILTSYIQRCFQQTNWKLL